MSVAPTIENGGNMQIGRFKVYLSAVDNRLTLARLFSHRTWPARGSVGFSPLFERGKSCPILVRCNCNKLFKGQLNYSYLNGDGELTTPNIVFRVQNCRT